MEQDRAAQDVGNIVALEHVNIGIADQRLATVFYVVGLGLTRDPYMRVGADNMWVSIGRSQFHLPTGKPQRVRGTIGIVVPDLAQLALQMAGVAPLLDGTQFAFQAHADRVEATCPWGNRLRCHAPAAEFGARELALAYIEFEVPRGAADGIVRFYREALHAAAVLERRRADAVAAVDVGDGQKLLFRESDEPLAPYDGHHIQIYVADFSGPHRLLSARGLIAGKSAVSEYRFCDIVDPRDGRRLFAVEHEVRSLRHPLYGRALINRNPSQNAQYVRGHDDFRGSY